MRAFLCLFSCFRIELCIWNKNADYLVNCNAIFSIIRLYFEKKSSLLAKIVRHHIHDIWKCKTTRRTCRQMSRSLILIYWSTSFQKGIKRAEQDETFSYLLSSCSFADWKRQNKMAISEDLRHPTQYLPNSQCTQITLKSSQFSSETFCLIYTQKLPWFISIL